MIKLEDFKWAGFYQQAAYELMLIIEKAQEKDMNYSSWNGVEKEAFHSFMKIQQMLERGW